MNRREFMGTAGVLLAGSVLPAVPKLLASTLPSTKWRRFIVTTHTEVINPAGTTRVWLPAALIRDTPFQRTISNRYNCVGGRATLVQRPEDALGIVAAEFPAGVKPVLTLSSEIVTRDYAVDFSTPRHAPQLNRTEAEHYLRPTKLIPTDGIVRETAMEITRGKGSELDKARCIYDWIVEKTYRSPKTRGCGTGNIRAMLETKDLGGKCADINSLYVGLARAAGLPARDVYGIRVAKSTFGYKSLGCCADDNRATTAQHCRAEVYVSDCGWVPVDPADVRKVMLEEPPGNRALSDTMVEQAHKRLFGSWEMNWMAFNFAQDVTLPGSRGPAIGFFMYPQAETDEGRLDSLDPQSFRYEITANEIES
jgi:transglutaminase-like putative cysteine protease